MIKTIKVDKYFNKGKDNAIHVINNTSLEFPKKGLVSLVGQSGSGKTTLLNVISGLDKANGVIQFDDKVISSYKSSVWDKIRAHDIGFVFQNYYLLEDRSVYENISLTLNMIGITDQKEVEYRVHYVLDAVGMYRFRKKKASDLSGGQKQRVAIARAIAKNPKVVIADEPTGNLDSHNSIEVMKIIKKISEERLVILVTHETNLADKYSNRIISLDDGSVVEDKLNKDSANTKLSFDDRNIYLGNLNKFPTNNQTKIYSNSKENDIKLQIIKINNNYYLQSDDENIKFNIVTPKSGITIINDTKENVQKSQAFETEFSLDELEKIKSKRVIKRTLSLKEAVIAAFRKVTNLGRKSKFQIFTLILLGIMFSVAMHTLFSSLVFDENEIYTDSNVYVYNDSINQIDNTDDYIIYNVSSDITNNLAIKLNSLFANIKVDSFMPLEGLVEADITMGVYPENPYEIVIDAKVLSNNYKNNYYYEMYGINTNKDLVGQKIIIHLNKLTTEFTISGVTNNGHMGLYIDSEMLFGLSAGLSIERELSDPNDPVKGDEIYDDFILKPINHTSIVAGSLPKEALNDGAIEVIIDERYTDIYPLNTKRSFSTFNTEEQEVIIVGYYETNDDPHMILETHDKHYNSVKYEINKNRFSEILLYSLNNNNPNLVGFENLREKEINYVKTQQEEAIATSITQMIVALSVSGLVFYFLVRSSLTARVKEISILRSLGILKREVISMYSLEYLILTAFTSLIGVIIGSVIANGVRSSFLSEFMRLRATPLSIIAAIVFIFISNILIALIPVVMLLRKTPAQMLTSYDI